MLKSVYKSRLIISKHVTYTIINWVSVNNRKVLSLIGYCKLFLTFLAAYVAGRTYATV